MRTLGEVEGRCSLSFGEVESVLWPLEGRAIGLEEDLSPSMASEAEAEGGEEEEEEEEEEGGDGEERREWDCVVERVCFVGEETAFAAVLPPDL